MNDFFDHVINQFANWTKIAKVNKKIDLQSQLLEFSEHLMKEIHLLRILVITLIIFLIFVIFLQWKYQRNMKRYIEQMVNKNISTPYVELPQTDQ